MKGVIFDLDGVLVDTAKYHFIAWRKLAEKLGVSFNELDNEQLKGLSRLSSIQFILEKGKLELPEKEVLELMDLKNNWYLELVNHMQIDEVLPNSRALLEDLKNNKIKIALGSASKNAQLILKKTRLLDYFDSVVDGTRTQHSKPNPEVFLKAADDLQLQPADCIVFEDAISGIEAANSGGFFSIGIGELSVLNQAKIVYPSLVGLSYHSLLQLFSK